MIFTVRMIQNNEYREARAVWDACFPEDRGGFSRFYFKHRTNPACVLGAFDERGSMMGALHMTPYPLYFYGIVKPCAMIAGVGTLPSCRHMGVAAAMINRAHELLAARGVCAALLKPDVDFYRQFGYEPFAYHMNYCLCSEDLANVTPARLIPPKPSMMLDIYEQFRQGYNGMMARDRRYMKLAIMERSAYAGLAYMSKRAYALGWMDEDGRAVVTELVGEELPAMLAALAKTYGEVSFCLPQGYHLGMDGIDGKLEFFNMIRVLDEKALLNRLPVGGLTELFGGEHAIFSLEYY